MKYKTVVYSTIRAEIHHDTEFAGKGDALAQIMECELLDYGRYWAARTYTAASVLPA